MYQHIFSPDGFEFEEIAWDFQTVISYSQLRAGDWVGYYFTGADFEGFWRKAYVIGIDRDNPSNTIAIVQYPDGTVSTFHSECDSLILWEV